MDNNQLNAEWPESFKGSSKLPGIPNIGNTCFANSTMQVLNHTPAFLNHFRGCTCDCKTKAGCKGDMDCDEGSEKNPGKNSAIDSENDSGKVRCRESKRGRLLHLPDEGLRHASRIMSQGQHSGA